MKQRKPKRPFMRIVSIVIVVICTLGACVPKSTSRVINVAEHGIVANSKQNTTVLINELINGLENEEVTIVFPKGRYDFYPSSAYFRPYYETNTYDVNPKRLAILIDKKKNITIDGQGSNFVYHGHIQPFTLCEAENITIKNLSIDWDLPLTAEAEVLEADSKHILIKIDTSQFPYTVHDKGLTFAAYDWEAEWKLSGGSWLIEYNRDHIIPAHTGDHGCVRGDLDNVKYSEVTSGHILMTGEFTKTPKVGHFLILRHSTRDHAGMFLFHSKNTKLQNIDVYHTSGLGILSQYCHNIEMQNVNMIPNLNKKRYLSGHDDGLHFMGCKGEIVINECDAQGLMDDPVNVHGTYVPVAKRIDDTTLKCEYAHSMSMGLIWAKKGDTIGFIRKKAMNTIGTGIVSEFKQVDEKSFTLRFTDKIPEELSNNYALDNLTCMPNVLITNCYVGSNRARGFLISTSGKVVIENNIFETSGSAILVAGDANYWYESGPVKDLTIRNNEFRSACNSSYYQFCNAVISIYPEIPEANPNHPYHRNIRIENNVFKLADYPLLYAKSVARLTFKDNVIERSYEYTPWYSHKYNFFLDACLDVEITHNEIGNEVLGKNVLLKNMNVEDLNLGNDQLSISFDKTF